VYLTQMRHQKKDLEPAFLALIRGRLTIARLLKPIPAAALMLLTVLFCAPSKAATADWSSSAPAWFPDSRHLVYLGAEGSRRMGLFDYDVSSGRINQIPVKVSAFLQAPTVSPDGKRIAFAVSGSGPPSIESDIYVADSDGGHLSKVVSNGYSNSGPAFSVNGDTLFYAQARVLKHYSPIVSSHLHEMDLAAIDLNSRRQAELTKGRYYEISAPAVDPTDGSVVVVMPGDRKDPNWQTPVPELTRFKWNHATLQDRQELRPDLSSFLQTDPWTVQYLNFYPWQDIYSPTFDSRGRLYFLWPTTHPETGNYDYETYRWDPKTSRTERLTNLHSHVGEVRPSPDGKWLALEVDEPGRYARVYLYSLDSREMREVPAPWK
jgi:Tol biopolymer transport system component